MLLNVSKNVMKVMYEDSHFRGPPTLLFKSTVTLCLMLVLSCYGMFMFFAETLQLKKIFNSVFSG